MGRWRLEESGKPINVVDSMYDGSSVDGVNGLRGFLLGRAGLTSRQQPDHHIKSNGPRDRHAI